MVGVSMSNAEVAFADYGSDGRCGCTRKRDVKVMRGDGAENAGQGIAGGM